MYKTGDMEKRFCKACDTTTELVMGNYKALQEGDRLYETTSSILEVVGKFNRDYGAYSRKERDGEVSMETVFDFIESSDEYASRRTSPLLSIIAPRIRAFRCTQCGSLIPIPGLP